MSIKMSWSVWLIAIALVACGGGRPADWPSQLRSVPQKFLSQKSYNKDDLYRFFAVAFGAAPGVTYMGQLIEAADSGLSIPQIVNIFTRKKQFTDVYPDSLTPTEFANRLINNVVGNSATEVNRQQAVQDIVSALALPGWSRGDVVFAIFSNLAAKRPSDPDWYGTAQKMDKQVTVAKYFTEVMQQSSTDLTLLRNVIAYVDETTDTASDLQASIDGYLNPAFVALPALLPDVMAKYDSLCGTQVNIQSAVAANLMGHKDGKKDLLFTL